MYLLYNIKHFAIYDRLVISSLVVTLFDGTAMIEDIDVYQCGN